MIDRYGYPEMKALWEDKSKFDNFLKVELLICEGWHKLGRIPKEALDDIKANAKFDLKRVLEIEATTNHDVIAFVSAVAENVGENSRYIHLGVTSSDVIDTSYCYMMVKAIDIIIEDCDKLIAILKDKANKYRNTLMMGRTHGIHAEPITFGLKLLIYLEDFLRAKDRLLHARENIAVGKISGPVGTYSEVPPEIEEHVCSSLGLKADKVSSQIVQRDRHAEYLCALAITGSLLEKMAVEIRSLQRSEIQEVSEPFAKGQKGSSAMPHKKNPILSERICGMSRVLRGNAQAALESIALWHERDISHSSVERIVVPDSTILLDYMLKKFSNMLENLVVNEERMLENIDYTKGLIFSGNVLLALVDTGMLRDDAYVIVQRNSLKSWEERRDLYELLSQDEEVTSRLDLNTLRECFDKTKALKYVDQIFARFDM